MDEEVIMKIIGVGLLILMFGVWMVYNGQNKIIDALGGSDSCGAVVDVIYEQCSEEGNINLTTIKGNTKTLNYENGICVIK